MSRGTIASYTPAKLRKVITDTARQVNDDNKINFGTDRDAHIEYNENGDDMLVISGSSKGIVLSGSTIQIAGTLEGASPLKIGGELQFTSTGSAGAFNFGPNQEASIYYSGEVANDGINVSDMLVISGTTNGGIVLSGSHTIVDSSLTIRGNIYSHGDVTVNAQDSVSLDPANNIILNPGVKTISHKNIHLLDNKRLYFGTDNDAYIQYDEANNDEMMINGGNSSVSIDSMNDVILRPFDDIKLNPSGKTIVLGSSNDFLFEIQQQTNSGEFLKCVSPDGNPAIELRQGGGGNGGIHLYDDSGNSRIYIEAETNPKIMLKNSSAETEGIIQHTADDFLTISGSSGGIVLSGSSVKIDGALSLDNLSLETLSFDKGQRKILLSNNTSTALDIAEGSNNYIKFSTTNNNERMLVYKELRITDDVKLKFGTQGDAHIEYNENGDDYLVVSGSSKGIVLSGSSTVVNEDLKVGEDLILNSSNGAEIKWQYDNCKIYAQDVEENLDTLILSASYRTEILSDLKIRDNKKLYFGIHDDAHIEYNEDGDDHLVISGSSKGIALSGSNIHLHGQTIISGSTSDFLLELQQQTNSGEFLKCTSPDGNRSIELRQGSGGNGLLYLADDDGNATLLVDPSYIKFRDTSNNVKGEVSYTADDFFTISGSSAGLALSGSSVRIDGSLSLDNLSLDTLSFDKGQRKILLSDNVPAAFEIAEGSNAYMRFSTTDDHERMLIYKETRITDDVKLKFGTNGDSYIKYNEDGDDYLIISGSSQGVALSGSNIDADTQKYRLSGGGDGTILSWKDDLVKLYPSDVDSNYDQLNVSASYGVQFKAGDEIKYEVGGVTNVLRVQSDSLKIKDDTKLYFGSHDDAYVEYNEDGDNYLIISGSSKGIALSGSDILMNSDEVEIGTGTTNGMVKLEFKGASTNGVLNWYPVGDSFVYYDNVQLIDNKKLSFGTANDAYIMYDEAGNDLLTISGSSQGLKLAGSKIVFDSDSIMSGTIAGPASYLGIDSSGQLVLTASSGGSGGDALQLAAGNNISLDTDENGLVTISYLPAHASDPIPDDDSEAASIVTGGALYWRAGSGYRMSLHNTGYLGVGITGSANVTHRITLPDIDGPGGQVRANGFVSYSTRRLKKDIEPLQNSLEIIKNLQGVSYKWKSSDRKDYGFIAEDVGKVLPGIVQWEENGKDAMSMDYNKIISFLVEAVKEQQIQIEKLNQRLVSDDVD